MWKKNWLELDSRLELDSGSNLTRATIKLARWLWNNQDTSTYPHQTVEEFRTRNFSRTEDDVCCTILKLDKWSLQSWYCACSNIRHLNKMCTKKYCFLFTSVFNAPFIMIFPLTGEVENCLGCPIWTRKGTTLTHFETRVFLFLSTKEIKR